MFAARSSGICSRCALYGGYASWRNVGPPGSIASTACVGPYSPRMEVTPFAKPMRAETLSPVLVMRGLRRNTKCPR